MTAPSAQTRAGGTHPARATLSACCAIVLGIGLGRFAYTPLIPALIGEHWFVPGDAALLGAANLAGYLAGALAGRPLAARWRAAPMLRLMMLLASLSFFACSGRFSFAWFSVWRLASGFSGGVLMVLAAPTALPCVPALRRGLAGGAIFTGVGLGIVFSATLVPVLMRWGLPQTWRGLGLLSLVLTALAWTGWPDTPLGREADTPTNGRPTGALNSLYWQYALNAVGLVPHMLFLVDYIARGLGDGLAAGARYWLLLGAGAAFGPMVLGRIADRTGFARAIRWAYLGEAGAIALVVTGAPVALAVSSLVVGACIPGVTALTLGRVRELVAGEAARQTQAWGIATAAFSVGQAAAGYGCAWIIKQRDDYALIFVLGAAALLLALVVNLASGGGARPTVKPEI